MEADTADLFLKIKGCHSHPFFCISEIDPKKYKEIGIKTCKVVVGQLLNAL